MFFFGNRLFRLVVPVARQLATNAIFLPSHHNLKLHSAINAVKYSFCAKTEPALTNDTIKKFVKYVIWEIENVRPGDSDFIGEFLYGEISRLIETRSAVEQSLKTLDDLVKQDPEMKKLGAEEYSTYESELESLDKELLACVLRGIGRVSCKDVILEVTTGVGGQEAMLFAKNLLEMYLGHVEYLGFSYEVIHLDSTSDSGGIRHASVAVTGERALEILRHEAGVHRVQRIPATEKSGRVHTSTVSVSVIPQPTDIEIDIKEKDLKIETKKASGAGGQHVNTTDSAVRITHLPTGITVESQNDRSQIKNRRTAMLRLKTMMYEKTLNKQRASSGEMRKKQIGLGLRNEKIRTYNFNQDRITDHRISDGTVHNLKGFLEGGESLEELQGKLQQDLQMKMLEKAVEKALKFE